MSQLTYALMLDSGSIPILPPLANEDILRSIWLKEVIGGCWRVSIESRVDGGRTIIAGMTITIHRPVLCRSS